MPVKKRKEVVNLLVNPNADVVLTITIGNAQIGASAIRFKDSSVILAKGEIKKCKLGKGSSLVGTTLLVTTNILDSNDLTDGVVATYFFGGSQPAVVTFDDKVDNDGDIFSFLLEFNFQ